MFQVIVVGIGGFIGASLRYVISALCIRVFGDSFPYGTLFVNILGGFLIGFIMEAGTGVMPFSPNVRIFLTTGLLGGLTTFSTFSYETISMLNKGSYFIGSMNIFLNLVLSLIFVLLGKFSAQII